MLSLAFCLSLLASPASAAEGKLEPKDEAQCSGIGTAIKKACLTTRAHYHALMAATASAPASPEGFDLDYLDDKERKEVLSKRGKLSIFGGPLPAVVTDPSRDEGLCAERAAKPAAACRATKSYFRGLALGSAPARPQDFDFAYLDDGERAAFAHKTSTKTAGPGDEKLLQSLHASDRTVCQKYPAGEVSGCAAAHQYYRKALAAPKSSDWPKEPVGYDRKYLNAEKLKEIDAHKIKLLTEYARSLMNKGASEGKK